MCLNTYTKQILVAIGNWERDDSWKKKGEKKGKEKFIHYKVKYKCIKLELSTSWVELGLGSTHHLT